MIQGHFEGLKHGFRQTSAGVVSSFLSHPNEFPVGFIASAMKTRFKITYE